MNKNRFLTPQKLIYLLLIVMTVVYARLSLGYYADEIETQALPQITSAMTQAPEFMHELEENEQAVRDVNDNLEASRNRIYRSNQDSLDKHAHNSEDVETLISNTLTWKNFVNRLRVERQGYVIVISKDDHKILIHPDERFVGETLHPMIDKSMDSVPDISEPGTGLDLDPFNAFFPASFFNDKISPDRILLAFKAGLYGKAVAYKDTYIICGVSFYEVVTRRIVRAVLSSLFFFLLAWIVVRYICFSLSWRQETKRHFRFGLIVNCLFAVAVLFAVTWYYQTLMDVTGDISAMNEQAQVAAENLNTYREYEKELSGWLDDQYLEQCRLAAEIIKAKGKESLSRRDLAMIAKELEVEAVYVFDKNGKVIVTNSPFDHFEISHREEDQSYAFRSLLDGRDHLIQEPMVDEMNGVEKQYIGVSLRDENDLADGFVQIAVDPSLRKRLLKPLSVQMVLDNLTIGLPEHALAIDKETMQIVATTGLGFEKSNVEDLGIDQEELRKNYNGICEVKGESYYVGVGETEDLFLMPLAKSTDAYPSFLIAMKLTILGAVAFCLIIAMALSAYREIDPIPSVVCDHAKQAGSAVKKMPAGLKEDTDEPSIRIPDDTPVQEIYGFENRWKGQNSTRSIRQTPKHRTGRIIYNSLLTGSSALILFEIIASSMGMTMSELDGFSYVLFGDWQKGINLFSFSYCLFLVCLLHVLWALLNQILYRIAKLSDRKSETILLLLRNALKYSCALIFLYIGLAKLGIDTKALWASAGVLSLMVGFGAKDLISDIISGLFIIFEGAYKIGDFVRVGEWGGIVQEIGLRYTKIAYFSETKIFNNSSIRDVINSDGKMAKEVLKIPIPYEVDLLTVEKLIERELPRMSESIPGMVKMPKYRGVCDYGERGLMLRFVVYSTPIKRKKALRALQRELKLLFDREHIRIPYNHVVVMDYEEENTDLPVMDDEVDEE